jgi:hypothetical protein
MPPTPPAALRTSPSSWNARIERAALIADEADTMSTVLPTPSQTSAATPPPTPMQNFVQLSALLTGIAADKLAPPLDPKNLKQIYFDYIQQQAGALFDQLLSIYAANASQPPANIADIVFNQSGADIRYLARSTMLAWYLGSWYAPADLAAGRNTNVVISAVAYTQGWAWNVAQAHAMGYSNFQFGYWASNPPSLSDFVGGN